jgi:hypothetical protein
VALVAFEAECRLGPGALLDGALLHGDGHGL